MENHVCVGFQTQGSKDDTNKYPISIDIFNIHKMNKVSPNMLMRIIETEQLCIAWRHIANKKHIAQSCTLDPTHSHQHSYM